MSRNASVANVSASEAGVVRPVYFFELHYDSGIVRVSSWTRELTFGDNTYLGLGGMVSIEDIQESGDMGANGVRAVLSGVETTAAALALNEHYQGRPAYIYLGYLDDVELLVDDPTLVYSGRMDTQNITMGQQSSISVSIENRLIDWDRPKVYRLNNETLQTLSPGDKGAEFVEQAAEKPIYWGIKQPS